MDRLRLAGLVARLGAFSLTFARVRCGIVCVAFTRVGRGVAGARTGVLGVRAGTRVIGALARVCGGIFATRTAVGRTFTRIGSCILSIALARVCRSIHGVRAVFAFLLFRVFLTRALIGAFAGMFRRVAGAIARRSRAFTRVGSGIAGTRTAIG